MGNDALIAQLRKERTELLEQTKGLPDRALRERPTASGWCILEVVAHLAAVDRHWLEEARAIRVDPDHCFVHFDDERWKREHPNEQAAPRREIFAATQSSFAAVLSCLAGLNDADLDRVGRHPRGVPYTVREVFLRYPAHDRNHAEQIRAIRRQIGSGNAY